MSDTNRMSVTDKAENALKPDSQKTTTEHFGDKFKGKADNAAGSVQPESEKSYTQKISDKLSGNTGNAGSNTGSNGESITQKTKNALGMGNK